MDGKARAYANTGNLLMIQKKYDSAILMYEVCVSCSDSYCVYLSVQYIYNYTVYPECSLLTKWSHYNYTAYPESSLASHYYVTVTYM